MTPIDPVPGERDAKPKRQLVQAFRPRPRERRAEIRDVVVQPPKGLRVGWPTLSTRRNLGGHNEVLRMPAREFVSLARGQVLVCELVNCFQQREAIATCASNKALVDER